MSRPIMVAIGGDSGSGKTSMAAGLCAIFGPEMCTEVRLDGYLALNRAQRNLVGITALDPRAHDFAAMGEDLARLAAGEAVVSPVYDHLLGAMKGSTLIEPRAIVLVQGMFPLHTRALRSLFDLTVWLEPDPGTGRQWAIARDVAERGYRHEQIVAELDRRERDRETFIAPQAQHADLRVRFVGGGVVITKSARLRPLEESDVASTFTHMRLLQGGGGPYPRTVIEVDARADAEDARSVEEQLWNVLGRRRAATQPGLGVLSGVTGTTQSHPLAIAQLLIARRIGLIADALDGAIAV